MLVAVFPYQKARAIGLTPGSSNILDSHGDDFGPSSNIHPTEEYPHNLTLHAHQGFKNKLFVGWLSGVPDTGGQMPSDTAETINLATSTIPEFPSALVLLLLMVTALLGVMMFRTKHAI